MIDDRANEMTERLLRDAGICAGMRVLEAAGLDVAAVRAEAIVQTADRRHPTAAIVRAMLPRIVAHGVTSAASIDIDTLDARLAAELRQTRAAYASDMVFSAWAKKPI